MRILIVKTSSLGDILHTFPVLDFLQSYYPHIHIDWVVEKPFSSLIRAHPVVEQVISLSSKRWRRRWWTKETREEWKQFRKELREKEYDAVFDLQGNIKSGIVTYFARSSKKIGFGRKTVAEWPNLFVTKEKFDPPAGRAIRHDGLALIQHFFSDHRNPQTKARLLSLDEQEKKALSDQLAAFPFPLRETLLVCPGSYWKNKSLPIELLIPLLQSIQTKYGWKVGLVWGNEQERGVVEQIMRHCASFSFILKSLSLPILQNVMGQVAGVIAMDSLPLHLAATTQVPTWSLFGPSLATKYAPEGEQHGFFQGQCPYHETFTKRCRFLRTCTTGACLHQVELASLLRSFDRFHNGSITFFLQ